MSNNICKYRHTHPLIDKEYEKTRIIDCYGIKVNYSVSNDGSGSIFKDMFVRTIKNIFPNKKFKHCLEWCSGPGFIGFSLLGSNIIEKLSLSDIHQPALDKAIETIQGNNLENVSVILSDGFQNIPEGLKFDLIIGNPPMFNYVHYQHEFYNYDQRLYLDTGWMAHRNFFKEASKYLEDAGSIILLENAYGCGVGTFREMIESSTLKIVNHFYQDNQPGYLWYLHVKKNV